MHPDISRPKVYINGSIAAPDKVHVTDDGFHEIALKKGDTFTRVALEDADLRITPIPVSDADRNLFGLSEKTARLPGHAHYYKQ